MNIDTFVILCVLLHGCSGPIHMHTFTYVSKDTYKANLLTVSCKRIYRRQYLYAWSKLGQVKVYLHHLWRSCKSIFTYK